MFDQISQFAAQVAPFALTGVLVSAFVQVAKQFLAKSGHKVLLLVASSLVIGAAAYFVGLLPQNVLTAVLGVLASANTVYVLFVKWVEPGQPGQDQSSIAPRPPEAEMV